MIGRNASTSNWSFDSLRRRYVDRLRSTKPLLAAWIAALTEDQLTTEEQVAIKTCAHHLAGSGGTYGFHHISAAAFATENAAGRALVGSMDSEGLRLALFALKAAIDDIEENNLAPRTKNGGLWGANISFLWARRKKFRGRVVIIEDDPDVADLLYAEFKRRAYDVEIARDGVAAVASIWNNRPHLIILDRGLPMMSGTSVFMELKHYRATRDIPLIVLSSLPESPAFNAPSTIYHPKPFDTAQLMEMCDDLALAPASSAG
ncbi:MAG: response regulator [Pseudomonadota bacterium]